MYNKKLQSMLIKAKAASCAIIKRNLCCTCGHNQAIVAKTPQGALWAACPICEKREDITPIITIYKAIGGWQSVLMSPDYTEGLPVMLSPEQTGMGPYGHDEDGLKAAIHDAMEWAIAEEIKFVAP